MIARSKTKPQRKAPKKGAKAKLTAAHRKPTKKPLNKKTASSKKTASKSKPAKAKLKPAPSKKVVAAKKSKSAVVKKKVESKGALAKSKRTPTIAVVTAKAPLPKQAVKKPLPAAKQLVSPIDRSTKSKVVPSVRTVESPKLATPAKVLTKTVPQAPSTKLLRAAKPAPPPRPVYTGPPTNPKIVEKIRGLQENREQRKDLAQPPTSRSVLTPHSRASEQPRDPNKDRLILMVRDPFWLHACWDITRKSVERAKASLAGHWHTAKPILRLLKTDDTTTTSNTETVYKDIEIHGGVRHWYIEAESPGSTFRLLLGYLFGNNRFHELARSNPVIPPIPGSPDSTDDHWADLTKDADRVYALSGGHDDDNTAGELQQMMQEKLKRPIGNPSLTQFGSGAEGSLRRMKNFHLDLDAEMVIFGTTHPLAVLSVAGEPVPVRSDGSFSARVPFPNSRQVLAATSKSRDGLDEQTIVLAVERITKIMEPLSSAEPDE